MDDSSPPTPPASRPARVRVCHLGLALGAAQVLDDVSLAVDPGETLVVLGGSGCGKTTLLKVLAGLRSADRGAVQLDGVDLRAIPSRQRRVVYLDQETLLFEHLNVFDNVAFGLRLRRVAPGQIQDQVEGLLHAIGLNEHAQKRSWQLSGGQKQRIAFARAILADPRVLLLDEPFGSLDARTRAEMQQLYKRLADQYRFTALLVTHDVREALVLGDRFAVMSAGRLRCYESRDAFVADESTGVREEIEFWKRI